jgi:membrane protease YdiL (CAAX protease family)
LAQDDTAPPIDEVSAPPAAAAPPALRPRPAWTTWLEIAACSGFPTQIFLSAVLIVAGINPLGSQDQLSGRFIFILSLADTLLLLSLIVALLWRRGESPVRVFFGGRPAGGEVAAGLLSLPFVFALVVGLALAIRRFAPELRTVPENPLEALAGDPAMFWMLMIVVIVAGGVREELQRAFLLHRFRGDFGRPWVGLLITSLAFGLGHNELQGRDAAVITGSLGAFWGAMYLTRGSALGPMVSHALFNGSQLLQVLLR